MIHMVHDTYDTHDTYSQDSWSHFEDTCEKQPHVQDPTKSTKMNPKVAKKHESECNFLKKVAKSPRGR